MILYMLAHHIKISFYKTLQQHINSAIHLTTCEEGCSQYSFPINKNI